MGRGSVDIAGVDEAFWDAGTTFGRGREPKREDDADEGPEEGLGSEENGVACGLGSGHPEPILGSGPVTMGDCVGERGGLGPDTRGDLGDLRVASITRAQGVSKRITARWHEARQHGSLRTI